MIKNLKRNKIWNIPSALLFVFITLASLVLAVFYFKKAVYSYDY